MTMQDRNAALHEAESTLGIHPCYHGVKREMKTLVEQAGDELQRLTERHKQLIALFEAMTQQLAQREGEDSPHIGALRMSEVGLGLTDATSLHLQLQNTLDRLAGHLKIVP